MILKYPESNKRIAKIKNSTKDGEDSHFLICCLELIEKDHKMLLEKNEQLRKENLQLINLLSNPKKEKP